LELQYALDWSTVTLSGYTFALSRNVCRMEGAYGWRFSCALLSAAKVNNVTMDKERLVVQNDKSRLQGLCGMCASFATFYLLDADPEWH
jgi:hypothetical protein